MVCNFYAENSNGEQPSLFFLTGRATMKEKELPEKEKMFRVDEPDRESA
jgi:hypothetical protein